MVLVEVDNADRVTVDQNNFDAPADDHGPSITGLDQVISAILGARQHAAQSGHQVASTAVTCADPAEAAVLREGLAARKVENIVLVSAFLAAASLAQTVGNATNYAHTALLFVEPDTATSAVVNTADGSVADVRRRLLPEDDDEAVAALVEMIKGADAMEPHPEGVIIIGSGIDIPLIKPALEAATSLPVNAPEEPEMALARGAALASVRTPLFTSSTAALAQAVGNATSYTHTAVLYVELDTATSALVNTADGSVADVRRRLLPEDDDEAVATLVEMVKGVDAMEPHPEGVIVIGSGVDIPRIKPTLEAAASLAVSALEMPVAQNTALASANAPLFLSSTAAVAYPHERDVVDVEPHLRGELYGAAVLEARNLCKSFGRGVARTPILKNIDLRISPGEFVALIGPSGSGKSTLLSILGLLEPPTSGDVLINQKSVTQLTRQELAGVRGRRIGYVFQAFNLLTGLSVAENVMLPSLLAGKSGRTQYDRAITLLDQFGLAALAKRVPAELSGGEQQRVAIARALFMTPDVILADEPTGNLDTTNGRKVINALYGLNAAGQTIILVTHDRSIANEAPRLVSLLDGRIETDTGPTQAMSKAAWRAGH
jgi:putative ABC transport system ATP-binding protein